MLLVPLALSVPGGAPGTGEEVVLAAGAPAGAGLEEPGEPGDGPAGDGLLAEASADVEVEAPADAPDGKVSARADATAVTADQPPAKRTSTTQRRKVTAARALTSAIKPKLTTTTTAAPQEPAPVPVTAARVATTKPPAPPPPPAAPTTRAPSPPPATTASDAVWDRLAECESGNINDGGAPYYGYWQFSAGTWTSMGGSGLPDDHPRAVQLVLAKRLQARSGWGQWPACSRQLGLT